MSRPDAAANWAVGKRLVHWGIAAAVVTALIAPKPEDGEGLVHVAAGAIALALVAVRLGWRMAGGVRPFFRDAFKIKLPTPSRGPRGFAPFLIQTGRLMGFVFLALIPIAAALGLSGVGQGEDSPLLEAHEVFGTTIMILTIAHALAIVAFAVLMKYDLIGVTLTGSARSIGEGGARGWVGIGAGAAVGLAVLAYVWGPYNVGGKVTSFAEAEYGDAHAVDARSEHENADSEDEH
ncbi:MAG: hypothetical protein K2P58_09275 [Hyphomonadaceae bacterium]|nr:hypothetical protein [Hyphomonadaceae bacterium]